LELAAGEHGAAPHRTKILGRLHGPATRDPVEACAARTLQPPLLPAAPAAPTAGTQLRQRQAAADTWACSEPPATQTTVQSGSGQSRQTRTPARARRWRRLIQTTTGDPSQPRPATAGPADHALRGLPYGPANRPADPGCANIGSDQKGNGIRLIPPLQNLSRPRPATAGPGGPRAARILPRAGHPGYAGCR
jgi:hypothetical protein